MSEVVDGNPFFVKSMLAYHPLFRHTHIPKRSINKTYNETMHRPIGLFSACLIGISIWSELPRPDGFRPHFGFSWSWFLQGWWCTGHLPKANKKSWLDISMAC